MHTSLTCNSRTRKSTRKFSSVGSSAFFSIIFNHSWAPWSRVLTYFTPPIYHKWSNKLWHTILMHELTTLKKFVKFHFGVKFTHACPIPSFLATWWGPHPVDELCFSEGREWWCQLGAGVASLSLFSESHKIPNKVHQWDGDHHHATKNGG